ncbi:hypothetical protein N7G274_008493 [Stereocaulon virgatum]|uniref:C2H2-type domain-containing protein n=1 Tax=Stereocaulon virgatum TaxID=373712 RepID=A0ABR3ZYN4_9LECA
MPPPWATNPAPKTESAREARKSFYCDLCQKGYSRINEFEAHEGSYDHQHKKRLKEMKQMSRDPLAATKARRAEEKLGAITIKPLSLAPSDTTKPGSGFKKGGFKNAFGNVDDDDDGGGKRGRGLKAEVKVEGFGGKERGQEVESESGEDEDGDRYDPRRPSGCGEGCPGRG